MYTNNSDSRNNLYGLKMYRRSLRRKATPAERYLWKLLHIPPLKPFRFRRQHSFGPYILDFYSPSTLIAIELDGVQHSTDEGLEYDKRRDDYLLDNGIVVLRFENKAVFDMESNVIDVIVRMCTRSREGV
ncbi:MAG: endonuclease domain-containing protein [Marinifilaceae bacterium]